MRKFVCNLCIFLVVLLIFSCTGCASDEVVKIRSKILTGSEIGVIGTNYTELFNQSKVIELPAGTISEKEYEQIKEKHKKFNIVRESNNPQGWGFYDINQPVFYENRYFVHPDGTVDKYNVASVLTSNTSHENNKNCHIENCPTMICQILNIGWC